MMMVEKINRVFSVGERVKFRFGNQRQGDNFIHGKVLVCYETKSDIQANSGLVYSINNDQIIKE